MINRLKNYECNVTYNDLLLTAYRFLQDNNLELTCNKKINQFHIK